MTDSVALLSGSLAFRELGKLVPGSPGHLATRLPYFHLASGDQKVTSFEIIHQARKERAP